MSSRPSRGIGAFAWFALGTAIAAVLSLSGCATPDWQPHSLAGTSWQLVSIESMSEEPRTVRPNDPSRYSLSFDLGGRAAIRLDCNRGLGAWKSTPSLDGKSGELSFEPLAATRMACAPGSLEPRMVRALPQVRGYVLRDSGHLSMMTEGGTLIWSPAR